MEILEKIYRDIENFFDDDFNHKRGRNSQKNFDLVKRVSDKFNIQFLFDDDREYSFSDEFIYFLSLNGEFIKPEYHGNQIKEIKYLKNSGNLYYSLMIKISDVGNYFYMFINKKSLDEYGEISVKYLEFEELEDNLYDAVNSIKRELEKEGLIYLDWDIMGKDVELNKEIDFPALIDSSKTVQTYLFGEI